MKSMNSTNPIHSIEIPFSDYSKRAGSITIEQAGYLWNQDGEVIKDQNTSINISSITSPFTLVHSGIALLGLQVRQMVRSLGTVMIGVSTVILLYLSAPFLALELRQQILRITDPLLSNAALTSIPGFTRSISPTIPDWIEEVPSEDKLFRLQIPSIQIDIDVQANVDPSNPVEYEPVLETRVAHAKGTGFPNQDGGINKSIYIFAHSTNGSWNITRYNAQFYALKDLEYDDEIVVWYWGEEHRYRVISSDIVEPNDTSYLEPQLDTELLILQTCWPPGTTEKRYVVVAEPITT